jgi:hypothetical protein
LHEGRHRRLGKKSRLLGSFANLWFAWGLPGFIPGFSPCFYHIIGFVQKPGWFARLRMTAKRSLAYKSSKKRGFSTKSAFN